MLAMVIIPKLTFLILFRTSYTTLMYVNVPFSGAEGIPLFYDWVHYAVVGGYSSSGWITTPPRAASLMLLDSGCPDGLSDK